MTHPNPSLVKDVASSAGQTPKAADGFVSPHSPGPWKLKFESPTPDYEFPYMRLSGGTGYFGGDEAPGFDISGIANEADARLMASAPDLLAWLKRARECIAYCRKAHKDIQSGEGIPIEIFIDEVIANAEGKS